MSMHETLGDRLLGLKLQLRPGTGAGAAAAGRPQVAVRRRDFGAGRALPDE